LNRIIVDALIEAGENAISVQPSASLISENGRIKEWYLKPVKEMLKCDLLPVPYGDVALDTKKGCCIISTEEILNYISRHSEFKKIILVGITNGVYDKDPTIYPDAKLIPEINSKNFEEIKKYLGESSGIDVTGGMSHKITKIFELTKFGVEAIVMSGEIEGNLKKVLLGKKVGTLVRL
jgi:isopentenyl phosphate kinase